MAFTKKPSNIAKPIPIRMTSSQAHNDKDGFVDCVGSPLTGRPSSFAAMGVAVTVGDGNTSAIASGVGLGVTTGVLVGTGVAVGVTVGSTVGSGVGAGVGVGVGFGVGTGVGTGVGSGAGAVR